MAQTGRRPAPVRRSIVVRRFESLSPNFVRVVFEGEELEGFSIPGPAPHIKLGFAAAGERTFVWPERAPGQLPSGIRPPTRTFTPRRFNGASGELAVDFFLHGDGVASTWAREARAGGVAGVSGPSRPYKLDPDATQFVIGGDETAIPAIGMLLETLGDRIPAVVVLELTDVADVEALEGVGSAVVTTVAHDGSRPAGSELAEALSELEFAAGARVWVASEAVAIRQIRRTLIGERQIPAAQLTTRGYWKFGEANHPDHDFGED